MDTIQIAITDVGYAAALRDLLVRNGSWEVVLADRPDPGRNGVIVLDLDHLSQMPKPVANPERVVLVARKESDDLNRAWEAGVNSVITDKDPLNTAVLAIMAARLRAANSSQPAPAGGASRAKSLSAAPAPSGNLG
jgi:CheY-like chemotaxis protein